MDILLSYNAIDIYYDTTPVVKNINFTLQAGKILGIVGESGSGKSTIVKAAMGLLEQNGMVTKGDIYFQGKNLLDLSPKEMHKICGAKISMVFQNSESYLCPIRTIGDQIYESMRAHKNTTRNKTNERALELFNKLSFKDGKRILNSYSFELSGGMNQRVGIAMAMLMNPALLLADEPTSALDVLLQKQIVKEMLLLRKLYGTAIILVTHNFEVVSAMADYIIVLKNGQIKEYGTAQQVLNYPKNKYTKSLLNAVPKLRKT